LFPRTMVDRVTQGREDSDGVVKILY